MYNTRQTHLQIIIYIFSLAQGDITESGKAVETYYEPLTALTNCQVNVFPSALLKWKTKIDEL